MPKRKPISERNTKVNTDVANRLRSELSSIRSHLAGNCQATILKIEAVRNWEGEAYFRHIHDTFSEARETLLRKYIEPAEAPPLSVVVSDLDDDCGSVGCGVGFNTGAAVAPTTPPTEVPDDYGIK